MKNLITDFFNISSAHHPKRNQSDAEFVVWIKELIKNLEISRVSDITDLDQIGIPVVSVCAPNPLKESFCMGKGLDYRQATISAAMEAAELRTCDGAHLQPLLNKSQKSLQKAGLKTWTIHATKSPQVNNFRPQDNLDWIECLDLGNDRFAYVPVELMTIRKSPRNLNKFPSTNGMASGTDVYKMISHALCELVERDALTISEIIAGTRISTSRIEAMGSDFRKIITRLKKLNIQIFAFDITNDIQIPSVEIFIIEERMYNFTEEPLYVIHSAAASHPSSQIAVMKALLESIQVRMAYFIGAREDITEGLSNSSEYLKIERRFKSVPESKMNFTPVESEIDSKKLLQKIVSRLKLSGFPEIYISNNSNQKLKVFSCSAFVPGLEGPFYDLKGDLHLGPRGQRILREAKGMK